MFRICYHDEKCLAELFSGGLDILFAGKRRMDITLGTDPKPTAAVLISHLAGKELTASSKQELFVLDGLLRPGILVLINEADWELEGKEGYELKNGDEVVFMSTLHGG